MLEIAFETCYKTKNPDCEPVKKQKEYYEGKHIMLLLNSQRLDNSQDKIDSSSIVKESTL